MPRACPVEVHARRYTHDLKQLPGCHGLVPWRFTLAATPTTSNNCLDATGLSRGGSRSSLHRRPQATARNPGCSSLENTENYNSAEELRISVVSLLGRRVSRRRR